jgi:hypothetical protein
VIVVRKRIGGELQLRRNGVRQLSAMAKAFGRFVRFIQSVFVPTTAIIGFSCLLTFFFVLYQPTRGPGDIQRLGWQSWDTISPSGVNETGNQPPPTSEDHDTDVDWWNVTAPGSTSPADSASLPLDVWAPLLPQDTGCIYFLHFCSISRAESVFYHDSVRDRSRPMLV